MTNATRAAEQLPERAEHGDSFIAGTGGRRATPMDREAIATETQ